MGVGVVEEIKERETISHTHTHTVGTSQRASDVLELFHLRATRWCVFLVCVFVRVPVAGRDHSMKQEQAAMSCSPASGMLIGSWSLVSPPHVQVWLFVSNLQI